MAITSNELRIGNYVSITENALHYSGKNFENTVFKISKVDDEKKVVAFLDFHTHEYCDDLKPIPLTEDWLVKFGFERGGYEGITVSKGDFEIHGDCPADYPNDKDRSIGLRINNQLDVYIEYVHELQNLYFALTKTELVLQERGEKV